MRHWIAAMMLVGACKSPDPLYCESHGDCSGDRPYCDLTGTLPGSGGLGRTCVPCPEGMTCASPDAAPDADLTGCADESKPLHTVTVTLTGGGSGIVTSSPPGIDCGTTCTGQFREGCPVSLTATPSGNHSFTGFAGDCGPETCDIEVQSDIAVTARFSAPGEFLWVTSLGSTDADFGASIAFHQGYVYATGGFKGNALIAGQSIASAGQTDIFVVKLDARDGSLVWVKRFGGAGEDIGHSIAVSSAGDLVVAGSFSGSVTFGGEQVTAAGASDLFVATLTSSGDPVWVRSAGGTGEDGVLSAVFDAAGDVFAAGYFEGAMNLGGGMASSSGGKDIFIVKYDGVTGAHVWSATYGGPFGDERAWRLATDRRNDVVMTGSVQSDITFGGAYLGRNGMQDPFVVKFDGANGQHLWSKGLSATGDFDEGLGVGIGPSDSVFVAGSFEGTLMLGSPAISSAGLHDVYVAKFSAAGSLQWSMQVGGDQSDGAYAVTVDEAGESRIAGMFGGTANFGGTPLSSAGALDIFAARLASDGRVIWAQRAGGGDLFHDGASDIQLGPQGYSYMTGSFRGFADFGSAQVQVRGDSDAFFACVAP